MPTLQELRNSAETAERIHDAACEAFGTDHSTWVRALAHIRGDVCRRNEDTSRDVELAANEILQTTWDDYISKLDAFYLLRDGPGGVLGGWGL